MITLIGGTPGAGKTAYMTYLCVTQMIEHGNEDYFFAGKEINKLSLGGFKCISAPPQRHCCYSDYAISLSRRLKTYTIDGFEIGLSNPYFNTAFLPPYSSVFLDEAQRYYDSRMSKYLRSEVYNWYQLHRHNDYNIYMACQRIANIDVNIRGIAEQCIVIDGITVKKDSFGFPTKITWNLRKFSSADVAESYMLAKERNESKDYGVKEIVSTNLDIFSYYNSKSNKPAFYMGNTQHPFDYFTEEGYQFTLDSFVKYNNNHLFTAPQGFWKNQKYDEKIMKDFGALYGN